MDGVGITVSTKLFQFHSPCGVAAVFAGGIARNPLRALVSICPTLSTLQGNDDADSFFGSHSLFELMRGF